MCIINLSLFLILITPILPNISKVSRLRGIYRIGSHNIDLLSIIFGCLLSDAHAEKRLLGTGTIITMRLRLLKRVGVGRH